QICEAPSTSLPRSFTINTSTATRERCWFVSDYSRDGGGRENTAVMRRPLDLRRNYCCKVVGRIDEKKACDAFEEEGLLSVSDRFKKKRSKLCTWCFYHLSTIKEKCPFSFKLLFFIFLVDS
ncbi:hypothetical protein F2Q70_00035205, partial [Brassica cretica]